MDELRASPSAVPRRSLRAGEAEASASSARAPGVRPEQVSRAPEPIRSLVTRCMSDWWRRSEDSRVAFEARLAEITGLASPSGRSGACCGLCRVGLVVECVEVKAHDRDDLFWRHQVGPQGGMHGEPVEELVVEREQL